MNQIRRNDELEVTQIRATFSLPMIVKVIYGIGIGFTIIILILALLLKAKYNIGGVAIVYAIVLCVVPIIIFLLHNSIIKKNSFIVTNKSIKGITASFLSKKSYNYRLDEIDNIEIQSSLGFHFLAVNFSQGRNENLSVKYGIGQKTMLGTNILRVKYLSNVTMVYEQLSQLLSSVKNKTDTVIDIEMKKIEAEERKAKAFENFTLNIHEKEAKSNDEIEKLEKLSALKEKGLITEQEYNQKKEELLHRI